MLRQRTINAHAPRSPSTSTRFIAFDPPNVRAAIAALFVAASLVLGGGGSTAPFPEMLLQLVAALAAIAWMLVPGGPSAARRAIPADWRLWVLAGLVLILPCLQLLPLPPSIWQNLPGREQERVALYLAGSEGAWMPWTLTPARTFASLLAMLPPLLAMFMVARLDRAGRNWVIAAVAFTALLSLVLGALQLSAGMEDRWRPYGSGNRGFLNGFQANRNAQADVLLIGLTATAAVFQTWKDTAPGRAADLLLAALAALFLIGCLLTGSRAGIALIPVALLALACIRFSRRISLRTALAGIAATLALLAAGFLILRQAGPVRHVLDRFSLGRDFRWELWEDTRFAIAQYWPFGSGIGSFRPIFIAAERLEVVDQTNPVRAHNDYLELALEGGIFGLMLLILASAWLCWIAVRAWLRLGQSSGESSSRTKGQPRESGDRPHILFSFAVFLTIALHSVVDYPMRSMAIACLAGVAAGLMSAVPSSRRNLEFAGR